MKNKILYFIEYLFKIFKLNQNIKVRNVLYSLHYFFFNFKFTQGLRLRSSFELETSSNIIEYTYDKNLDKLLLKLNSKLDLESKRTINKVIDRCKIFFKNNLIKEVFIHDHDEFNEYFKIDNWLTANKNIYRLSKEHYDCGVLYYHHGLIYLPKVAIKKLENTDFIDGGAYIGDSSVMFSKQYKPKRIFSFEPINENYLLLKKTIQYNNLKNVIPIQKGLGNKKLNLKIHYDDVVSRIEKNGERNISLVTIDGFINNEDINVGLIKLDIEGYELETIIGAKNTIKKFKPVLLISIYHTGKDFFEIKPLIESWNLNYKFIIRKLNPLYPFAETMLIAYQ